MSQPKNQSQQSVKNPKQEAFEEVALQFQKFLESQAGQVAKKEGFWGFLKSTSKDESDNPSSSRTAMYIQLAMAAAAFVLGVLSMVFSSNTTLVITMFSTAVSLTVTAMRTNAAAQKKSASIQQAREATKQAKLQSNPVNPAPGSSGSSDSKDTQTSPPDDSPPPSSGSPNNPQAPGT